jgi:hypothetical protein
MKLDRYWYLFAAANILLLALAAMVNDGLAGWSVSVFLAGPCVVWPALRLSPGRLLLCLGVSGLAADAALPTPPGFLMCLFVAGAIFVLTMRLGLSRVHRGRQIGLAWLLNAVYFLAFTAWAARHNLVLGSAFFERATVDFCLSQIVVIPVSIWFFDFQESALALAGLTTATPRAEEAG